MCSTLKLFDTLLFKSNINTNCAFGATNNYYFIITDGGIYILQLCSVVYTISPSMSFKKWLVTIPQYSPSAHLGIDLNLFVGDLEKEEIYETVLNLDLSEKISDTTEIKQEFVQAKWSPIGLVANNHMAIAGLTNRGCLNIFIHTVNEVQFEEYTNIINITEKYIELVKPTWVEVNGSSFIHLQELKSRVNKVLPTAFEWSHLIESDNSFCYMFVAHLNGDITVWTIHKRLLNQVDSAGIKLISTHKTDLKRITALFWQQVGGNGFLLAGDLDGRVILLPATTITEESISFDTVLYLWNEIDRIQIEYFKVVRIHGETYILIVKQSFLLICLINELGDVLDIYSFHAGNVQISGIDHLEDNILLIITHTGVTREIKLINEDNKLRVDWKYLYINYPWHLHRTHGIIASPNRVFIAVLIGSAKINDIRKSQFFTKLLMFRNTCKEPLNILIESSMNSLTSYWDCLEVLRITGMVDKKIPCNGLPSGLNYDKLSIMQLKTCYWLEKYSEALSGMIFVLEEHNLPPSDELQYILKIKLACKHIQKLFEKIIDGKELHTFHMQSLDILNMYLKEVVVRDVIPSLGLGKCTIAELYENISAANELQYPEPPKCQLCNEDIIGTACIPHHVDTRCSISLMQVVDIPYYKCMSCSCVIHWRMTEIYSIITCPWCDTAMDFVSVLGSSIPYVTDKNISACSLHCLKEDPAILLEIEDHAFATVEEHIDLLQVSSDEENDTVNIDNATELNLPQT